MLGERPADSQNYLLMELFVQSFSVDMPMILTPSGGLTLATLQEKADEFAELPRPAISLVATFVSSPTTTEEQILLLTGTVHAHQLYFHGHGRESR